jgi:predicted Zn-dependent peptidase
MVFSAETDADIEGNVVVPVLRAVVDTRLREVIREALGAAYTPSVQAEGTSLPRGQLYVNINVEGDPAEIDEVSDAIKGELEAIVGGDISADELDRAIETVATDFELWQNELLADTHLLFARHPSWDYGDFVQRDRRVRRVSKDDVVALAATVLDLSRYVEVHLLPAE